MTLSFANPRLAALAEDDHDTYERSRRTSRSHFLNWRDRTEEEEGFTLMELMIVVLIIGILAAIALPIYTQQQNAAWAVTATSDTEKDFVSTASWFDENPDATQADYETAVTNGDPSAMTNADTAQNFGGISFAGTTVSDGYMVWTCNPQSGVMAVEQSNSADGSMGLKTSDPGTCSGTSESDVQVTGNAADLTQGYNLNSANSSQAQADQSATSSGPDLSQCAWGPNTDNTACSTGPTFDEWNSVYNGNPGDFTIASGNAYKGYFDYTQSPAAANLSVDGLPAGLSLVVPNNGDQYAITGTASTPGTYPLTFTLTGKYNGGATETTSVNLVVK